MVPPSKHTTTTKLSFVRLAAQQHHRAHAGSTAGRTGLLALTRQLTSAPKAARVSHMGAGVAQRVAGAGALCKLLLGSDGGVLAQAAFQSAAAGSLGTAFRTGEEVHRSLGRRGGGGASDAVMWAVSEVVAAVQHKGTPVPYRISKLTRYLQDTLQPAGTVVFCLQQPLCNCRASVKIEVEHCSML
jgi:hypothetical protein